jgi:nicotinamide-nucleotide amidase
MPSVEILSQGDEVITGQTVDTNASWLAEELTELGFDVVRHVTVGDRLADIRALFAASAQRADLVVCTGGLGPTDDDLTAQAASEAFDRPLFLDEEALRGIKAMYAQYGRTMPAVNQKQAWFPQGSHRLDNPRGTAPGFAIPTPRGFLACMPGVPHEMKRMFRKEVVPHIEQRFDIRAPFLVTLRTTGVGESNLQERIGTFEHDHIVLSYRTQLGENQVKLRAHADTPRSELEHAARTLNHRIGSPVFSIEGLDGDGGDLPTVVGRALAANRATLAVAESCTGGRVAGLCTSVSGSSAWFIEGVVTYANASKQQRLGVPESLIAAHGAVSEPVARAMAEGVRRTAGTTYGLSTTGIAGPGGGSDAKPVGTVHIALSTPDGTLHRLARFGGSRHRIQHLAAYAATDLLRRHLQGFLSP